MRQLLTASFLAATVTFAPAIAAPGGNGNGLAARVQALEDIVAGLTSGTSEIAVNCGSGETITAALAQPSSAASLKITVSGTCTENVVINRSHVTLEGTGGGELNGSLTIVSSVGIVLKDMTFHGSGGIGIVAQTGSGLRTDNIEVRDFASTGVAISDGSSMRMENSRVFYTTATGFSAVGAFDNSNIRLINNVIRSDNATLNGVALASGRGSNVRIEAGNRIENTTGPNPNTGQSVALHVYDNSNIRLQRSGNIVIGNVRLESGSTADMRDFTVTGNFRLSAKSHMTMANSAAIAGDVLVDTQSLMEAFSSSGGVSGTVTCQREGKVALSLVLNLMNCTNI